LKQLKLDSDIELVFTKAQAFDLFEARCKDMQVDLKDN
jgi:hypothetical protein